MGSAFSIRHMHIADLAAGRTLQRQAGWNQTEGDWRRFLALNPQGCFVGCVDDRVVATTTTAVFGPVGWIAMVLVDESWRGRGFGTAMLNHAIDYLSPRVETIKLDATELGRPLYEKLGFQGEYELTRYELNPVETPEDRSAVLSLQVDDELLAFDAAIYGTDRSALLRALADEGHPGLVVRRAGRVIGYAMMRPGDRAAFVGPALADDEEAYGKIVNWLRATVRGLTYLDVPHTSRFHARIQEAFDLKRQRGFLRMYRGRSPFSGQPETVLASSSPEKG